MSTLAEVLIIAVALGADAFSVSVGIGTCCSSWGSKLRLAGAFGLAQFVMPVIGWSVGSVVLPYVKAYDHWVAFGILVAIGLKMLWESFQAEEGKPEERKDPTRSALLFWLAVAVSIDALAVGFTMGTLDGRRWIYATIFGIVAALMTLGGSLLGHHGSRRWGAWAERGGAILLLGVAVKILLM